MTSHPSKRNVNGVTFTRVRVFGQPGWYAVVGPVHIVVDSTGKSADLYRELPFPKNPVTEPPHEDLTGYCRLNKYTRVGANLTDCMEQAVWDAEDHRLNDEPLFLDAKQVPAGEVKVGDRFLHKGVFFMISAILPKPETPAGYTFVFSDRNYPLWIQPQHLCVVA